MIFKKVRYLVLGILILCLLAGFSGTATAQPKTAEVLITFDLVPGHSEQAVIHQFGGIIRYSYQLVPAIAAEVPEAAIAGLLRNPRVIYIEPDSEVSILDEELNNSWGVKRIGAGLAHDQGNNGEGIKVAVLDTGIDYLHPDLNANYAGGWDFVNDDGDPMDDYGHGTHCAGIVAAEDNGIGVVGVAPEAELYALKVMNASGHGNWSDIIAALEWCVDNGIQVTSNSYGGPSYSAIVEQAFDNAYAAGVLSIAAAGNRGQGMPDTIVYPAKYGSVIAVSATDSTDRLASFSSIGPAVELAAPGVAILSTVLGGGYATKQGTSMACPHVAGSAALVIFAMSHLPSPTIRQRLTDSAEDLGSKGRDTWFGYGLVNAFAATFPPEPGVSVKLSSDERDYQKGIDSNAVLTAIVANEYGEAITGLGADAFSTIINDVPKQVLFTTTADAGVYEGKLDIPTMPAMKHQVAVTVTDSRGFSGVGSTNGYIYSAVIAESTKFIKVEKGNSGKYKLALDFHIVDAVGMPVNDARIHVKIKKPDGSLIQDSIPTDVLGNATLKIRSTIPLGLWEAWVYHISAPPHKFDPTKGDPYDKIIL